MTDLEGAWGVDKKSMVSTDSPDYPTAVSNLLSDINAAIDGAFLGGATEVWVRDGHGGGNSIIWENLIPGVKLMQGASPRVRFAGLEGCDAVILLGYHAMAGTPQAVMEHSYSSKHIQNIWFNGEKIGEFGIDTMIAGEHGLPVIMTSGCDKLCKEAKDFSPEVVTCQVKESTAQQGCIMLSPADSEKLLREKTLEAIAAFKAGKIKPLTAENVTFRVEFMERMEPQAADLVAPRTVEVTDGSVEKAFYRMW